MKALTFAVITGATFAATSSIAAGADRRADADEHAAIGAVLHQAGYTKWSNIELDDGKWEVENAVRADGKVFDVDLAVADLRILKEEIDD